MKASHPFARSGSEAVVDPPASSIFSNTSYSSVLGATVNPSAAPRTSTDSQVTAGSNGGMAIRTVSGACPDYY
jgi:hypothetical protein